MTRNKKIIIFIIIYLVIGYGVIFGMYLRSNPGYLQPCPPELAPYKCTGVSGLIGDLAVRPDFWLEVLAWPISAPLMLFGG